jgi:homocitrate synthase
MNLSEENMKKTDINFKGFIDTTLREGQQSPLLFDARKYRFNLEDKKSIIKGLIKIGVRYFEFFSPIVNNSEERDFMELKEYIKSLTKDRVYLIAHCRCHHDDIDNAIKAGFNGLNLYMSVSKIAQKYNYKKDYKELKDSIRKTIIETREKYPDIYLRFSTEDAFRTEIEDMFEIYDEISSYVNTLGMPDTVGIATPEDVALRVRQLKERYPDNNIECHFHNDRGYSLINAMIAIKNGAEFVDTSIWGLGERSGITSITGLLFNLYSEDRVIIDNYNINLSYPLNIEMGSILKLQVPYNEPVSLTNRTHIAGVHQKAVINNKISYEGVKLEKFGVDKNHILLGPLSGWHSIYYYLNEILDYEVSEKEAKLIRESFKNRLEDMKKSGAPVKTLDKIANEFGLNKRMVPAKEKNRRVEIIE